jgi:5-bromo-4-chloroindolyl phosphate hydrolysis protein
MRLQKRYIYAAFLSIVVFLILYIIVDFSVLICIPLTAITYVGGIFLFKEKDVRVYNAEDINRYYFQTSKLLSYRDRVEDDKIKEDVEQICDVSTKILSAVSQKPKKVTQVFNFYDYYMNLILRILERYVQINNKEQKSANENKFLDNVDNYLDNIKLQFDKQLDNMYKTSTIDIDSEIALFEKVCNIKEDKEISVGEKNE